MKRIDGLPCTDAHIVGVDTCGRDVRSGARLRQWTCSCGKQGRPRKRELHARAGAVCHVAREMRSEVVVDE